MAPPYSKQLPPHPASFGIVETRKSVRDNIDSIWHTVWASRRSIEEAREAIARADEALARRPVEPRPTRRPVEGPV